MDKLHVMLSLQLSPEISSHLRRIPLVLRCLLLLEKSLVLSEAAHGAPCGKAHVDCQTTPDSNTRPITCVLSPALRHVRYRATGGEGYGGHTNIDGANQLLTIDLIGEGAGRQCELKERQQCHGRHQRKQQRRLCKNIHHPGRRAVVRGHTGSGDYRGNP